MTTISKKGFTLVELLIVIGILAVLATTAVVILNPAQLLAQARDSQRLSDLGSINSALALYMTEVTPIDLGTCSDAVGTGGRSAVDPTNDSFNTAGATVVDADRTVDGTGWVDVDLTDISSGSPLPSLPVDPTNSVTLVYRYACNEVTNPTYELNATLESTKYASYMLDTKDGGDKDAFYEVGTDLTQ